MGLETAAIIGIAASAAAGGASIYATNKAAQGARETNDLQIGASYGLQKDAQQYNTQMYERNLADSRENYQTQLVDARANYEMQRDDQEAFYNKYLSATGMAKQLRQAGVNPASYFGAGKGISQPATMPGVNATNMQTPAAPSSPMGSIGGLNNPNLAYASLVPQLTKSITDLSQAGLMDAQKKEISTLLESKLHKLMADIGGQEALNTQLALENEITRAFGKKKAAAEIKSLTQQAFFYSMSGKTEKAKAALTSIQEQIGRQDLKIKTEQALTIATLLQKQINFVDEQIKTEQSKQNDLGASAKEHLAGVGLKNLQSRGQEIANNINGLDEKIKTDPQYVKSVLQSELAKVRALALQSNNDEMIKKIDFLITKSRLNMYEDASPTDIQLRMALKELGSMLSDIFPFFKASGAAVGSAAAGSKIGK